MAAQVSNDRTRRHQSLVSGGASRRATVPGRPRVPPTRLRPRGPARLIEFGGEGSPFGWVHIGGKEPDASRREGLDSSSLGDGPVRLHVTTLAKRHLQSARPAEEFHPALGSPLRQRQALRRQLRRPRPVVKELPPRASNSDQLSGSIAAHLAVPVGLIPKPGRSRPSKHINRLGGILRYYPRAAA